MSIEKERADKNINRAIEVGNLEYAEELIGIYLATNLISKRQADGFKKQMDEKRGVISISVTPTFEALTDTGTIYDVEWKKQKTKKKGGKKYGRYT